MALSESDMQVLATAVSRADKKGEPKISIRTSAVVELGGVELLPKSDQTRYDNTPESGREILTSQVPVAGMKKLLEAPKAEA